ncbi:trypsin-like peptidase domain-containing protein [Roseibacillus persicicus]|uniref:Peptidase S1 domain-containing protein n=1 Tax=Roseibacillus persicicus TaxID=454148 RepID=A0A918TDD6_9BACT|nr:trypsin-like peptidase domain-containing protein [Roseibacillus persicicus]GHC40317.1 hypothetical protein GCM10007100_00930 [Roseibacillus persicicus]
MKFLLLFLLTLPASAIVWQEDAEPQTEQEGEMRNVGKVFYSPLQVHGGTCLALGGKWVLTCRHGTEKWPPEFIRVSFPALEKKVYKVKKIHFPESGDLALLELGSKVKDIEKITFAEKEKIVGMKVWLGGFGKSGPAGDSKLNGTFHGGYNRVDKESGGKWSLSLSKKGEGEKQEATVAIMDSGSPLFVETKDGWKLCGIASTASNGTNPSYGDRSNYAKVQEGVKWIRSLVK